MSTWAATGWDLDPLPLWRSTGGPAYRVYSRPTRDGVDTLVATLAPGTVSYLFTGAPMSEAFVYVRAVGRLGREDEEPVQPKLRRVAFDVDGNLILAVPQPPFGQVIQRAAGGVLALAWRHRPSVLNEATVNRFWIYIAEGDGAAFDLGTPDFTVVASGNRIDYSQVLGTFAHGTLVRAIVRAVAAHGSAPVVYAAEANAAIAEARADALAPDAVADFVVEVA